MDFWLIFIMCVDFFFFPNLAYTLVIPVSAGGFGGLSPDGFCYNCMWIDRAYWLLKSSAAPVLWVICPWTCMLMAVRSAWSEEGLWWVDGVLLQNRNNYILSILPHGCWWAQVPHSRVAQQKPGSPARLSCDSCGVQSNWVELLNWTSNQSAFSDLPLSPASDFLELGQSYCI